MNSRDQWKLMLDLFAGLLGFLIFFAVYIFQNYKIVSRDSDNKLNNVADRVGISKELCENLVRRVFPELPADTSCGERIDETFEAIVVRLETATENLASIKEGYLPPVGMKNVCLELRRVAPDIVPGFADHSRCNDDKQLSEFMLIDLKRWTDGEFRAVSPDQVPEPENKNVAQEQIPAKIEKIEDEGEIIFPLGNFSLFPVGKSVIDDEFKPSMKKLCDEALTVLDNAKKPSFLEIRGHSSCTFGDPASVKTYVSFDQINPSKEVLSYFGNLTLSFNRARSFLKYCVEHVQPDAWLKLIGEGKVTVAAFSERESNLLRTAGAGEKTCESRETDKLLDDFTQRIDIARVDDYVTICPSRPDSTNGYWPNCRASVEKVNGKWVRTVPIPPTPIRRPVR